PRIPPPPASARDVVDFFGPTVLAVRRSPAPAFVLGAMLPDFATMIRARPPRTTHTDIDSGMQFHWRTDEAFHRSAAFLALTHQAVGWLSARGVRSGSALAVAHGGVEIRPDAALAADDCAQQAYRAALEGAAHDALGRFVDWASHGERARFDALRARLLARGAVAVDITPETVAERLRDALAGRPRLALDAAAVRPVRAAARTARAPVAARAPALAQEPAAQPPPPRPPPHRTRPGA